MKNKIKIYRQKHLIENSYNAIVHTKLVVFGRDIDSGVESETNGIEAPRARYVV